MAKHNRWTIALGSLAIGILLWMGIGGCQSLPKNKTATEYAQYGRTKLAQGNYKGAVQAFDAAIRLESHNPQLLMSRGLARSEMGQLILAIEDYTLALAKNPKLYEAFVYRGIAHNRLNQPDQALTDLSQAIALKPDSAPALTNRAMTYYSLGQTKEAIADLKQAQAIFQQSQATAQLAELNQLLQQFQAE